MPTPLLLLWLISKGISAAAFALGHRTLALWIYVVPDPWFILQWVVPRAQGFGPVVSRFRTDKREVWLTIDDGPDPATTPGILDALDAFGARATFFLIGEQAARHPQLVADIVRRGHSVGNHTQSHPSSRLWRYGRRRIAAEIDACESALQAAGAGSVRLFRPPVGIKNPFIHPVLAPRGLRYVAWSARGYDAAPGANPQKALQRLLAGVRPGAILLVHEGKGDFGRVTFTANLLRELRSLGYQAVLPDETSLC